MIPTPKTLQLLQKRRQALLRDIRRPEPLIAGTVCDVLRRCGNPTCHCAKAPTHRQTLLLYKKRGRRTSKFIRKEDAGWVRQAWRRYQGCRAALRELRSLQRREWRLLQDELRARGERFMVGGEFWAAWGGKAPRG